MKLNKPEVTESQTVLEEYVVSLLIDPSKKSLQVSQAELTAVAKIEKTKAKTNPAHSQVEPATDEDITLKQVVSDVIPLKQKSSKPNKSHGLNQIDVPISEKLSVPVLRKPAVIKVQNRASSKSDKVYDKPANQSGRAKAEEIESALFPNNGQIDEEQSKNIQQKHTEKINQEIEAYSHQESSQKTFKDRNEKDPRLQGVEKLLAKIALANVVAPNAQDDESQTSVQAKTSYEVAPDDLSEVELASSQASFAHREKQPLKEILGDVFQTLVFEVGKLPLAVPLIKLGGIVNVSEQDITPLVGTPDWFMGLVPHEKGNLMVVDTQQFLMPEQKADEQQNFQYLIILDDSLWALACHSVGDAKNLTPEDIRWSSGSSRRPWFAGMVVEYMSALIEVDRLINMLTENIVD